MCPNPPKAVALPPHSTASPRLTPSVAPPYGSRLSHQRPSGIGQTAGKERMRDSLSRVFPLFVLSLLLTASLALAADPPPLEACVNSGNGNLRLVDASVVCHANETRVSWNVAGPAGPAGPAGAAGPAGPAGPAGAD